MRLRGERSNVSRDCKLLCGTENEELRIRYSKESIIIKYLKKHRYLDDI